jgi:hypothetical protein
MYVAYLYGIFKFKNAYGMYALDGGVAWGGVTQLLLFE